jgi:hypothetical protein
MQTSARHVVQLALATLMLAAACGDDAEARRVRDERRAYCEAVVPSGVSSAQVAATFGLGLFPPDCLRPGIRFASTGPGDRCPYDATRVCERTWQFFSGARCYQCRVRSVISAESPEPALSDAPACATVFYDDQPCF